MSQISILLRKTASPRGIATFFLLYLLSFILIGSRAFGTARLRALTGGVSIPDVEMMGYSPQHLYDIFTAQGEAGRAFYLHTIIPQDIPLPFFYSMFFAASLTYLAQRLFPAPHPIQYIGWLGLGNGLVDWAENLCFTILVLRYPQRLITLAVMANLFTISKTALAVLNFSLIAAGLAWLVAKGLKAKAVHRSSGK